MFIAKSWLSIFATIFLTHHWCQRGRSGGLPSSMGEENNTMTTGGGPKEGQSRVKSLFLLAKVLWLAQFQLQTVVKKQKCAKSKPIICVFFAIGPQITAMVRKTCAGWQIWGFAGDDRIARQLGIQCTFVGCSDKLSAWKQQASHCQKSTSQPLLHIVLDCLQG